MIISKTTLKEMSGGKRIIVPSYQRSYSWDSRHNGYEGKAQTEVFLNDIKDYINQKEKQSNYYMGQFLFKEQGDFYEVIDGQQRLTTSIILLSVIRSINPELVDTDICKTMLERDDGFSVFETVEYDANFFREYILGTNRNKKANTLSAQRMKEAFEYFESELEQIKNFEDLLKNTVNTLSEASCNKIIISNDVDAVKMFVFQNNRGKKTSNLEMVKAQLIFYAHLYGKNQVNSMINNINSYFTEIYKALANLSNKTPYIEDDDILRYTWCIEKDSLITDNEIYEIEEKLKKLKPQECVDFINYFPKILRNNFEYIQKFFCEHEAESIEIHSFIKLGYFAVAMPFILKAYIHDENNIENIKRLCIALEGVLIRQGLIGSKARLAKHLNNVFSVNDEDDIDFDGSNVEIVEETIQGICKNSYWNDDVLEQALQEPMTNMRLVKHILYKYENYLRKERKDYGYKEILRYEQLKDPQVEHIAPQSRPNGNNHGYGEYPIEFQKSKKTNEPPKRQRRKFLRISVPNIGNLMLVTGQTNREVKNNILLKKIEHYKDINALHQHREFCEIASRNKQWKENEIKERRENIFKFLKRNT